VKDAQLVASLEWYPHLKVKTPLRGLVVLGCREDRLHGIALQVIDSSQLYGGDPFTISAPLYIGEALAFARFHDFEDSELRPDDICQETIS